MSSDLNRLTCQQCEKHTTCTEMCIYVEKKLSHVSNEIPSLGHDEKAIIADYKDVLTELRAGKESRLKINIDKIRKIKDLRLRALALLIYGKITIADIARFFGKSPSQIYRIIKKGSFCLAG
ncbi:MAG: helix-turn-helix domain-containing protein [Nitrospirae bacterium]|nr:helix-turn-helix domain-containing protein [Nitrospirota bacterium]